MAVELCQLDLQNGPVYKFKSQAEVISSATEEGLVPFFSTPNELFLDLDFKPYVKHYRNYDVGTMMSRNDVVVVSELTTTSKGGKGKHVYLRLNREFSEIERCALQAALGSDPKKEALMVLGQGFSALFETPTEAAKVIEWRSKR